MNPSSPTSDAASTTLADQLARHLFADPVLTVYAVLDGAAIPDLIDQLYAEGGPEFACLYRGELAPDLAYCAPYLVRLSPGSSFTRWLLAEGWGKHWGIFAAAAADFKAMQKHFRSFMMVKDPRGKQLYFRYYDPRVLRMYLPTCNKHESDILFAQVKKYWVEDELPANLLAFSPEQLPPRKELIRLFST